MSVLVLVVDDEPSMRHLLSVILDDRGYDVRAVSSAEAGSILDITGRTRMSASSRVLKSLGP